MMGRFFTAPLVVAIAVLARTEWLTTRARAYAGIALAVGLGLLAPWEPALLSGYGYSYANNWTHGRETREPADGGRYVFVWQSTERRFLRVYGLKRGGLRARSRRGGRTERPAARRAKSWSEE
jgi:hypothetical protein